MACPGGWVVVGVCGDYYTCNAISCGSNTEKWRHTQVYCYNNTVTCANNPTNCYGCYWNNSYYEGCC